MWRSGCGRVVGVGTVLFGKGACGVRCFCAFCGEGEEVRESRGGLFWSALALWNEEVWLGGSMQKNVLYCKGDGVKLFMGDGGLDLRRDVAGRCGELMVQVLGSAAFFMALYLLVDVRYRRSRRTSWWWKY